MLWNDLLFDSLNMGSGDQVPKGLDFSVDMGPRYRVPPSTHFLDWFTKHGVWELKSRRVRNFSLKGANCIESHPTWIY